MEIAFCVGIFVLRQICSLKCSLLTLSKSTVHGQFNICHTVFLPLPRNQDRQCTYESVIEARCGN